eukprot:scaffold1661_cov251-Pinguiococcus_pyrenoidosus.AAC.50
MALEWLDSQLSATPGASEALPYRWSASVISSSDAVQFQLWLQGLLPKVGGSEAALSLLCCSVRDARERHMLALRRELLPSVVSSLRSSTSAKKREQQPGALPPFVALQLYQALLRKLADVAAAELRSPLLDSTANVVGPLCSLSSNAEAAVRAAAMTTLAMCLELFGAALRQFTRKIEDGCVCNFLAQDGEVRDAAVRCFVRLPLAASATTPLLLKRSIAELQVILWKGPGWRSWVASLLLWFCSVEPSEGPQNVSWCSSAAKPTDCPKRGESAGREGSGAALERHHQQQSDAASDAEPCWSVPRGSAEARAP